MAALKVAALLHLYFLSVFVASRVCPCEDQSLCNYLTTPPRQEILAFHTSNLVNWTQYDWNILTTIALFVDDLPDALLCKAHSEGVRLVWGTSYPVANLSNAQQRSVYVQGLLQLVENSFTDGINIDIEEPIPAYSREVELLTQLTSEVYSAFSEKYPGTQVTFDVPWSPDCLDGRCYDWIGLAQNTDFLVIMGYDLRSQVFGPCVASANSPPDLIYEGIWEFMTNYGINASQLVLGVPWYGYDYTCLNFSALLNETPCEIAFVPFRGVNCSDAAGTQLSFEVIQMLLSISAYGRQWSSELQSPYFYYEDQNGNAHQVWYDDPHSLSVKYALAKRMGLRGLSMWDMDEVYYGENPTKMSETEEMWNAMAKYF